MRTLTTARDLATDRVTLGDGPFWGGVDTSFAAAEGVCCFFPDGNGLLSSSSSNGLFRADTAVGVVNRAATSPLLFVLLGVSAILSCFGVRGAAFAGVAVFPGIELHVPTFDPACELIT